MTHSITSGRAPRKWNSNLSAQRRAAGVAGEHLGHARKPKKPKKGRHHRVQVGLNPGPGPWWPSWWDSH